MPDTFESSGSHLANPVTPDTQYVATAQTRRIVAAAHGGVNALTPPPPRGILPPTRAEAPLRYRRVASGLKMELFQSPYLAFADFEESFCFFCFWVFFGDLSPIACSFPGRRVAG
jgi:hypothetical protein